MKETYYLNADTLPLIPIPHDCVIKEIQLNENELIFIFENDISYHDSIKNIKPDAKSLTITFHLSNEFDEMSLYIKRQRKLFRSKSFYEETDLTHNKDKLLALANNRLEYLDHYIGYNSIIVNLFSFDDIALHLNADSVEFDWLLK